MINQNDSFENTEIEFLQAFKQLKLSALLKTAGITKAQGASAYLVFQFLVLLVFQGKNLFRFLTSKYGDKAFSKNTYYRFLNTPTYNWRRFLLLLSAKVISMFNGLTRPERIKAFVIDDSVIERNRSKEVELLANTYDHVFHRFVRGFTLLALGWTDGYSFVPVDFAMLSSGKEANRYQETSDKIDKRTNGFKRRKEAISKKSEVVVQLVRNALKHGIHADYVLMDTWFTNEPMLKSLCAEGLDVIGMLKQLKQLYRYKGKFCRLEDLRTLLPKNHVNNILGSVIVETKAGIKVKLVFVRNRNKKNEWLTILSTDLSLEDAEIVRIYGNRWSIEVFFKASKSFMKLGSEFQGRSYDLMISHTTIVFVRYIILEWLRRNSNDQKTLGELFFMFCDDIQDMDLTTALESLMSLFIEQFKTVSANVTEAVKSQLQQWISSQALFIQALFKDLSWES